MTGKTPYFLCNGQKAVLANDLSIGQIKFTHDQVRLLGYFPSGRKNLVELKKLEDTNRAIHKVDWSVSSEEDLSPRHLHVRFGQKG